MTFNIGSQRLVYSAELASITEKKTSVQRIDRFGRRFSGRRIHQGWKETLHGYLGSGGLLRVQHSTVDLPNGWMVPNVLSTSFYKQTGV